ncbi:uncharacterized protein LOC119160757 isoform X2 [Rhipicephalus microplus]|uniref:uncharacterized protein LOC119160757 isoform X2 n=1 Tax=Rhipicephalus microplus TaxID=6941 RepID=UPI001888B77F|nr:uncharacterized protein LOC119160757 isoform X2 [Rhipicephalus microplus]
MIASIVRLAADPWSRRQHPVPKVSWLDRHPRFTLVVIGIGGTCLMFSRFIYDFVNSMLESDEDWNCRAPKVCSTGVIELSYPARHGSPCYQSYIGHTREHRGGKDWLGRCSGSQGWMMGNQPWTS